MNIAIMFNGEFRWFESFKRTFQENFSFALEGHNVQYFAYFWNKGLENLPNFINICNPIIINLENQKSDIEIKKYLGFTKIINGTFPYQIYCAHRVFLLLQQYQQQYNTNFDLYIRMRVDLAFPDKVNFDNFDLESVYSKKCHGGTSLSNFHCDFAYFTKNYDAVQKMAKFGMCLDAILENTDSLNYREFISQNMYCPEELLAKYVDSQKLSTKFHDFDIQLARNYI
jgi:hypothetical protein